MGYFRTATRALSSRQKLSEQPGDDYAEAGADSLAILF